MQTKPTPNVSLFQAARARTTLVRHHACSSLRLAIFAGALVVPISAQAAPSQKVGPVLPKPSAPKPAAFQSASALAQANRRDALLGPDDVLQVTVLRHEELSVESITVPSSGRVDLPRVGSVMASGKTLDQLAREIERRLSNVLVRPSVTVALKQGHQRQVYVLGAVKNPNAYSIKPGWRISEALAAAGDLTQRADETTVNLARAGGTSTTFDANIVTDNPTDLKNYVLMTGDVLTFTHQELRRVTISGDVTKPDTYPIKRAPRLLDALNAAGWLKQQAPSTRAFLIRNAQRTDLDVSRATQSADSEDNIQLKAGDLIMVEAIPEVKFSVNGLVGQPGNFSLPPGPEGISVIQALAQAGGLTVTPDLVTVNVRRGARLMPVDVQRAALDPSADMTLQTGDVVQALEPEVTRVQITGQVQKPGALRIPTQNSTLAEAIARAGGPTSSPLQTQISVLRQVNGKPVALQADPVKLLEGRDLSQNVRLQDGDLISVTPVRVTVAYITGEVAKPGSYELKPGDGVAELIARAGGPTQDAALTKINLSRGEQTQIVDAYDTLKGAAPEGTTRPGGALLEGDYVVVPKNMNRISVIQSVQRPGSYAIPEHETLTVADAISLAGGPRDRATAKEVAVVRSTPQGVDKKVLRMDRIFNGDLTQNIALQPGDIVVVPQTKVSQSFLSQVGALVGLGLGARALGVGN